MEDEYPSKEEITEEILEIFNWNVHMQDDFATTQEFIKEFNFALDYNVHRRDEFSVNRELMLAVWERIGFHYEMPRNMDEEEENLNMEDE